MTVSNLVLELEESHKQELSDNNETSTTPEKEQLNIESPDNTSNTSEQNEGPISNGEHSGDSSSNDNLLMQQEIERQSIPEADIMLTAVEPAESPINSDEHFPGSSSSDGDLLGAKSSPISNGEHSRDSASNENVLMQQEIERECPINSDEHSQGSSSSDGELLGAKFTTENDDDQLSSSSINHTDFNDSIHENVAILNSPVDITSFDAAAIPLLCKKSDFQGPFHISKTNNTSSDDQSLDVPSLLDDIITTKDKSQVGHHKHVRFAVQPAIDDDDEIRIITRKDRHTTLFYNSGTKCDNLILCVDSDCEEHQNQRPNWMRNIVACCPCCHQNLDNLTLNEPKIFPKQRIMIQNNSNNRHHHYTVPNRSLTDDCSDDEDNDYKNLNIIDHDNKKSIIKDEDAEDEYENDEEDEVEDFYAGVLAAGIPYQLTRCIVEGWVQKKGTGFDWIGSRSWKTRWARLCLGRVYNAENTYDTTTIIQVPLLCIYWYPTSTIPTTVILLNSAVVMAIDSTNNSLRKNASTTGNEAVEKADIAVSNKKERKSQPRQQNQSHLQNSYKFEIRHAGSKENSTLPVSRTFRASSAKARDAWVYNISQVLLSYEKEKAAAAAQRTIEEDQLLLVTPTMNNSDDTLSRGRTSPKSCPLGHIPVSPYFSSTEESDDHRFLSVIDLSSSSSSSPLLSSPRSAGSPKKMALPPISSPPRPPQSPSSSSKTALLFLSSTKVRTTTSDPGAASCNNTTSNSNEDLLPLAPL